MNPFARKQSSILSLPQPIEIKIRGDLSTGQLQIGSDKPLDFFTLANVLLASAMQVIAMASQQASLIVGAKPTFEREEKNGKENDDSDKGNIGRTGDGPAN